MRAAAARSHAVSLDWDNHPCAAAACTMGLPPNTPLNASIANCTYHLQMSRLVGSSAVPVTAVANESIVGRAAMLVAYLAASEGAAAGWGRFLRPQDGTRLLWENTTIMGHSRGASCEPPTARPELPRLPEPGKPYRIGAACADPPLAGKLFPAQRAIMTGGDGDSDELTFLPWHTWPDRMRPEDLYSLNPIFTSPFGQAVPDPWFFSVTCPNVPEIWLLRLLDEPKNVRVDRACTCAGMRRSPPRI